MIYSLAGWASGAVGALWVGFAHEGAVRLQTCVRVCRARKLTAIAASRDSAQGGDSLSHFNSVPHYRAPESGRESNPIHLSHPHRSHPAMALWGAANVPDFSTRTNREIRVHGDNFPLILLEMLKFLLNLIKITLFKAI